MAFIPITVGRHTMHGYLIPGTAEWTALLKYRADIIRSIAHFGLTQLPAASRSSRTGFLSIAVASAHQGRSTCLQKPLARRFEICKAAAGHSVLRHQSEPRMQLPL